MLNKNLETLESELASVNEYLKDAFVNDKVIEVVNVLSKRSSLLKRISELRWTLKSKQEQRLHRESELKEIEKYFHKYGESEKDVAKKYNYKKAFIDLLDSIIELESIEDEQPISSMKAIVDAMQKILNSGDFIDVTDKAFSTCLDALFLCLSLCAKDTTDSLQEKINISYRKYNVLKAYSE